MVESITGISNIKALSNASSIENNENFKNILKGVVDQLAETQNQSESDLTSILTGKIEDLHSVMINIEKADIALQLAMQVKNKVVDAYKEIMDMQI